MTTTIQACYTNFITRLMTTTGLPITEMQTFNEWVQNRKNQFNEEADEKEKIAGFEAWLEKKYN